MKTLIKKILKEELSDEELNWVSEVDPVDYFGEWVQQNSPHKLRMPMELQKIEDAKVALAMLLSDTEELLGLIIDLNDERGMEVIKSKMEDLKDMLLPNSIGQTQGESKYGGWFVVDSGQMLEDIEYIIKEYGPFGEKYNLTLQELLDVSEKYFERKKENEKID